MTWSGVCTMGEITSLSRATQDTHTKTSHGSQFVMSAGCGLRGWRCRCCGDAMCLGCKVNQKRCGLKERRGLFRWKFGRRFGRRNNVYQPELVKKDKS